MAWDINDEQDKRILKIIGELENVWDILEAWRAHIQEVVTFPFKAKIVEVQDYGSIVQQGDRLNVHSIEDIDEKYGIIVHTRFGKKKIYFPLCDLESINMNDEVIKVMDDYAVWFANR